MLIKSMLSAFLMYSRIPVPQVEWKDVNRRYSLCFFPLVGAFVGGAELLWFLMYRVLGFNSLLFGTGSAALPIILTGGIHMDGYCDVNDALASCGTREKMLNIMSDPNIGSFAAVRAGLYLLIQLGLFAQIKTWPMMAVCALSFVQSRALSGLGTVLLKSAKESGALQSFRRPADRRAVIVSEPAVLLLTLILAALADPICGGCAFAAEAVCFVYYRKMSYKKFGGVTGDLAGYFLQICELGAVGAAVFADLVRSAVL